jgi:GNAT superfamily N-acetyltransferase
MIRLARYEEAAVALSIVHRGFAETRAFANPSSALREGIADFQRAFRSGGVVLAFAGDAAIGTARVRVDPPLRGRLERAAQGERFPPMAGAAVSYARMAVVPEHRGEGHGRRLAEWIEALADRLGAEVLEADARSQQPDNRPFYQAMGFTIDGYSGRYGIPDIRTHLSKRLRS